MSLSSPEAVPNTEDEEVQTSLFTPTTAGIASLVVLVIGGVISWALNTYIEAAIAFGLQWLVFFCQSWPQKSEKYFDLTGSITFQAVSITSFFRNVPLNSFKVAYIRNVILTAMVVVWALRLGSFLFARIRRDGSDGRFDHLKSSILKFLVVWNMQGLWVFFLTLPVQVLNSSVTNSKYPSQIQIVEIIGWCVWIFGFGFEAISDRQKSVWREDPSNKGKFIDVGLWSISRHPNYFGEITLWWGQFIACGAVFSFRPVGILGVLSPLYTMLLLIRVSGIPMLEARSDEKWGGQPDYEEYKINTPVLVPFCYCWH